MFVPSERQLYGCLLWLLLIVLGAAGFVWLVNYLFGIVGMLIVFGIIVLFYVTIIILTKD